MREGNKMSDLAEGVGKKIVEALKQQIDEDVVPNALDVGLDIKSEEDVTLSDESVENLVQNVNEEIEQVKAETEDIKTFSSLKEEVVMPDVSKIEIPSTPIMESSFTSVSASMELDDLEIPANVAVLRKLITQLPAGVSKQMGAQIIKQTMEALGISMKSVLQEAQQLQQSLNNATQECHNTIQEYKRNIVSLERQAQNHQRQYAAINDLISLFIQTNR